MKQPVKIAVFSIFVVAIVAAFLILISGDDGGLTGKVDNVVASALVGRGTDQQPHAPSNGPRAGIATNDPETRSATSAAHPPRGVPVAGVILPEDSRWSLRVQPPAQAAILETVNNAVPDENKHGIHLIVTAVDRKKFWAAQMIKRVPREVFADRQMAVRFWGRSVQQTPVWVVFEEGRSPHTPELQVKVTLTPEWRQYDLPFRTTRDHVSPHANFCIKAGIQPGEIEVSGIYVEEY
ncbi:MAG: hypothetical protein H7145_01225 [Akkermansiaceae bacterium]|nr:hypothetical protein [Armatimonadota bacterium]